MDCTIGEATGWSYSSLWLRSCLVDVVAPLGEAEVGNCVGVATVARIGYTEKADLLARVTCPIKRSVSMHKQNRNQRLEPPVQHKPAILIPWDHLACLARQVRVDVNLERAIGQPKCPLSSSSAKNSRGKHCEAKGTSSMQIEMFCMPVTPCLHQTMVYFLQIIAKSVFLHPFSLHLTDGSILLAVTFCS